MTNHHDGETILIIEDEADIQNLASRLLDLEGYCILQAEDGEEGLRLARESRVDLVLLDLRLPKRDGWSVLAVMKSDLQLRDIHVIVFTASAAAPQQDRAQSMGAADYLVKPLSVARLREAVIRILHPEKER